jgi:para-aminobenzoate synthetase/4-amino-4-deoxychorismate lyase
LTVVLYDAGRRGWVRYGEPVEVLTAWRLEDVLPALRAVEAAVAGGRHAAGFLAYEAGPAFDPALACRPPAAGLPLLAFGIYRGAAPCAAPPVPPGPAPGYGWQATVTEAEYHAVVERIRGHIRAGDTYQVNYTFRLRAAAREAPEALFARLVAAQPQGFPAFVAFDDWAVCSASPELFFTLDGERIVSRPMKGTAARGPFPAADAGQARWLADSVKDRAENAMIADMVRNDLGRVAVPGSVAAAPLFALERHPTLWQMTSTVEARTQAGLADIFAALFPPASITGAPKVRTARIIAECESTPRGVYTGAIGFLAPGRRAQFNVAIRTAVVHIPTGVVEYGVGSGIVWDSDAAAEWAECRTKTRVLDGLPPAFDLLETFAWTPAAGFALRGRHLARLAASAAHFDRPCDAAAVGAALDAWAAAAGPAPQRVRLLVAPDGSARVEAAPLAPLPRPYRLRLASAPVDPADVFLYHKTTSRGAYDRARASAPGADDVLLWNARGEITETCIANVAVERGGRLVTPPVACGLLAGVQRAQWLEEGRLTEDVVRKEEIGPGTRVVLLNAVRGGWEGEMAAG